MVILSCDHCPRSHNYHLLICYRIVSLAKSLNEKFDDVPRSIDYFGLSISNSNVYFLLSVQR